MVKIRCVFVVGLLSALGLSAGTRDKSDRQLDGFADEDGNFVSDKVDAIDSISHSSDWGTNALGAAGHLVVDTTFKVKPVFRTKPVRSPGPTLVGGGQILTICAPTSDERPLAEEIAWHLREMSGAEISVSDLVPKNGPAVVLTGRPDDGGEESSIHTEGDRVYLSGAGAGLSHAVTYFLEQLGIRYLFPGRLGKVIPKRANVTYPETEWSLLKVRL